MKKMLPILLVVAMALPALAEVDVTAAAGTNPGELIVTITPSNGAAVRGVALVLNTDTGDAVIDGTDDVVVSGLNTNIDYFFTNGTGGVAGETPAGEGHPIADPAQAGVLDPTGGVGNFSLSSAYLDAAGTQLGQTSAMTFTVTYTGTAGCVSVAPDTLRGAIVGDNLGAITYPSSCVTLAFGDPCKALFGATAQALYDRYVTAGKDPSSWCWQYQCYGDATNSEQGSLVKVRVGSEDLGLLLASWNKKPETGANPACDFNHAEQGSLVKVSVGSEDLGLLLANWNKKSADLTNCSTYLP